VLGVQKADALTARKKILPTLTSDDHIADRDSRILFVESNDLEFAAYRRKMKRYGMWDVSCISNRESVEEQIKETFFNIIIIEVPNTLHHRESLNLLNSLRALGFRGVIAMIAESTTMDIVYRCTRLGASEFLLKTHALDIGKEVSRLLDKRPPVDRSLWHPHMNLGFGLFTSAGLSSSELEIVSEFAKGFSKHGEIAKRLGKSHTYVRKHFSRIYNKLSASIAIENSAQLAHLITICSLYT
jgi:DNA-binding NarL/FixJ family response regulator